jgi:hypothetical protein
MAITEQDQTFLMDLAALLKAFRETRDGAAQVGEQLTNRLEACRDLDTKAATALTKAVQQATASLRQEQARMIEQSCAELRSQHKLLLQHWQGVVDQAAQVQRWLSWKVALLLLGSTLLVNAAGALWWSWHQAADLQALRTHKQLAVGLTHYLANTLYPQLSKAQQRDVDALFKEAGFAPLGPPRH